MKVLRIHGTSGGWGGAEDYILNTSKMLESRGHPQRLLVLREGKADRSFPEERTLPLPPMGAGRVAEEMAPTPYVLEFLRRNLEEFRPDIVHLHNTMNQQVVSIVQFVSELRVPVVMTGHDATLVCPIATLLRPGNVVCEGGILPRCLVTGCEVGLGGPLMIWRRRAFDRLAKPKIQVYFCPSKALASAFESNGYRPAQNLPSYAMIPEGVRTAPPTRELGPIPRIGFIGRIDPVKGVDDLLRAVASLRGQGRKVILDVAGAGPDQERLRRIAEELGVTEAVEWTGRVYGAEKERWYRVQNLVVVPSRTFENFPLVALEALVRQVPVVATGIGGIPEIVRDNETGRIVPFSDPEGLARGIAEMLDQPAAAAAWAARGRRMVLEEFTPEIHVERLLAAYQQVLGNSEVREQTS